MTGLLFVLMSSGPARGEEEKGTTVDAGIKMWINNWNRKAPGSESTTSNNVLLVGPSIEAEFHNRLYVEATYLLSTYNYKFDEAGVRSELERHDLDLVLGRHLNRYVGGVVGYRNLGFKEKETGARESSYGLFYSLQGTVPMNETISLYAMVTYLDTRFKAEGQAREDAPGWVVEAGIKYALDKKLTGGLGYKYETTKGDDSSIEDTFSGATISVMYSF